MNFHQQYHMIRVNNSISQYVYHIHDVLSDHFIIRTEFSLFQHILFLKFDKLGSDTELVLTVSFMYLCKRITLPHPPFYPTQISLSLSFSLFFFLSFSLSHKRVVLIQSEHHYHLINMQLDIAVSEITFIMYAHSQKVAKPNNLQKKRKKKCIWQKVNQKCSL